MQLEDLTFKEYTPGHGVGGHNVIYPAMRILRGGRRGLCEGARWKEHFPEAYSYSGRVCLMHITTARERVVEMMSRQ